MTLYKEGKFTFDSLATAHMSNSDVFQELTLKVRNSHLTSALLLELQVQPGQLLRPCRRPRLRGRRVWLPSCSTTSTRSCALSGSLAHPSHVAPFSGRVRNKFECC